jgi:hypothetical protein
MAMTNGEPADGHVEVAESSDADFGFGERARLRERKQMSSRQRERERARESGSPDAGGTRPSLKPQSD